MAQRTNTSSGAPKTALACISAALIATVAVALSCTTSAPTPTAAPTPQPAPTATQEPSPTATAEATSTPVPTPTASPSPTPTATATATATPSPTPTVSPLPTATPTPLPTPTPTPTPIPTPTATPVPTQTPTPAPTATPTPTPTPSPTPTATPIPLPSIEEQRAALEAFYAATGGDNWNNNYGWLTDLPLEQWHGVTTDQEGNVIRLWLPENNLSGPIPADIVQLESLEILYLTDNQLLGDVPHELWQLISLTSLYLSSNKLTGNIPPEIGNLTSLQSIGLSWNDISGTIPKEIWQLTALTQLDLQSNNLTGTVPPEIGNLMQLNFLGLASNELTGMIPDEIGRLTGLEWVYVSGNRFEGCVPDELRLVENNDSDQLNLIYCGFNPSDPDDRAVLVKLYNATNGDNWHNNEGWLSDLPLDEWHGVEVNYLGRVARLVLWQNNLRGTLIPEIGQLDSLVSLRLAYNRLSGPIPSETGGLKQLETLWLQGNNLTGEIPVEVTELGKIWSIELNDNEISGPIPPTIGQMTNLEQLNLSDNRLSGPLSPEIGQAADLRFLNLSGNELDGVIPTELANLTNLTNLALNSNKLTGEFPAWVGSLPRLEHLKLGDNQLTGDITLISEDLGELAGLRTFSIAGNDLAGCLPVTLRNIDETDLLFSTLGYCDEPPKQPPVTPEFIKWVVGDAVRPVEERAARLGVQWLFEYAESIGWPIVGDDITVYFMTLEPLVYASTNEDGVIDEGEIESQREFISGIGGFAREDSNFNRATEVGDFINRSRLFGRAEILIHENIHTAFQRDINGLYTNPSLIPGRSVFGPAWFTEGMASYFDALITSRNGGETDFLCRGDCELTINGVPVEEIPLASAEDVGTCEYACGAFAIELLASIVGQRHIVDIYTMRRPGQTWQQTFEEVFGMSVPDFYALYDQHRAAGFPELNPPIVPETGR